jgi:hypothetical protein
MEYRLACLRKRPRADSYPGMRKIAAVENLEAADAPANSLSRRMSALGQTRNFASAARMSALLTKADARGDAGHVRQVLAPGHPPNRYTPHWQTTNLTAQLCAGRQRGDSKSF